ncbi:Cbp2p Ecym_8420 [Eremothecium cymbalariae DBVPG|uniref:Uncharacterized protein n=1 Tax=Eremothecium cymbalariae (strain CBS 270.75 / DBVPG 7215 / KCTC 17166 / NRRL Y-17582) TaxID=931890 RepID=G8JXW5_ERECY|nr:Hypothetical protein Ecym_8420 [Eremothecium cymbalariae DBVPG\
MNDIFRWKDLFFVFLRRKPAHAPMYRDTVRASGSFKDFRRPVESGRVSEKVAVEIPDDLLRMPLSKFKDIIVYDATKKNIEFKFYKNCGLHGVGNLQTFKRYSEIAQLFMNPVDSKYAILSTKNCSWIEKRNPVLHPDVSLTLSTFYTCKIKLFSTSGESIEVLWPSAEYSLLCRGVGVTQHKFDELSKNHITHVEHPLTKQSVPVIVVDSIQDGVDAIGLFPCKIPAQAKFFYSRLEYDAILPSRTCNSEEVSIIDQLMVRGNTGQYMGLSQIYLKLENLFPDKETIDSPRFSTVQTVSMLLDPLKTGRFNTKETSRLNNNCSPDVLRGVLFSSNIDNAQLRDEFYKLSLLKYAYDSTKIEDELPSGYKLEGLRPYDHHMIYEFRKLQALPLPQNMKEISFVKQQFDTFIRNITIYRTITKVNLEEHQMRSNSQIVQSMLYNCKFFPIFYPNLYAEIAEELKDAPPLNLPAEQPGDATLEFELATAILHMECEAYKATYESWKISETTNAKRKKKLKTFQIVITTNIPLIHPYMLSLLRRISKCTTRILTPGGLKTMQQTHQLLLHQSVGTDTNVYLYQQKQKAEALQRSRSDVLENAIKLLAK